MYLGAFICTHICTYTQDCVMVLCNPLKKVQYELDALCSSIYTNVHIYPHCANIYILTVRVAYLLHVQTMLSKFIVGALEALDERDNTELVDKHHTVHCCIRTTSTHHFPPVQYTSHTPAVWLLIWMFHEWYAVQIMYVQCSVWLIISPRTWLFPLMMCCVYMQNIKRQCSHLDQWLSLGEFLVDAECSVCLTARPRGCRNTLLHTRDVFSCTTTSSETAWTGVLHGNTQKPLMVTSRCYSTDMIRYDGLMYVL
jgi:hypothetical protein